MKMLRTHFRLNAWRSRVLAVAVSTLAIAGPAASDTLADALAGAYMHSGLLDQNRALLRAADEDVAIAASSLRPILNWQANATRNFGTSGVSGSTSGVATFTEVDIASSTANLSLIAQMRLYDAGASRFRTAAAKETVLATRAGLLGIEQQVLLNAVSAFMTVRQASEFVALRKSNLRLLTEELRAAEDRFEVGEVTRTDVALAEARLAQARSGVAASERDLQQAFEFYRSVVGRAPGTLAQPPKLPRTEGDIAAAKDIAARGHPTMLAAQHRVSVTDLLVKAAKADLLPTVSLSGRLQMQEEFGAPDYRESGSVSLDIGGPIYSGGRLSAVERRAIAQRDAARGDLHAKRNDVVRNVGNAIADLRATQVQLEASDRQIRAARVAFRGVREEAALGARTTLDVLDAEQELLDAQAARIQAEASQYVAAYSVLASMGLLTAEKLNLDVQLYDPAAYYDLAKDGPAKLSRQGKQLDKVLRALGKDE